jgi:microcin C transport system substrate-binding protein
VVPRVRTVDPAQYQKRMDDYDFDMTVESFGQSESPGNEQRSYWGSQAADNRGEQNAIGIKNPAVDALIDLIIQAPDRQSLVTSTRALDRILQWGFYVVPNWHIEAVRVAYWDKFTRPPVMPRGGYDQSSWWVDQQKEAALRAKRGR